MKVANTEYDIDGVYNNTRSKDVTSQTASSDHKYMIVEEGIKHSSKKKKVEEVVESLVKYHHSCTSNCKEHNKKKSNEDIKILNEYYRTQVNEFHSFENKSEYLKLCNVIK